MNKKYIVLALMGAGFVFSSCEDEFMNGATKKNFGDEIVFGARAGFENSSPNTRTIYTGDFYETGSGENKKEYEKVHWVVNDQIRVFCGEAAALKTADYTVTATNTGVDEDETENYHDTQLQRVGDASLQWGNTSEVHDFYAVYPSPLQYVGQGITESDVLNGSAIVKGVIPSTQVHIHKSGIPKSDTPVDNSDFKTANANNSYMENAIADMSSSHYIVQPDMKYAYMVARTQIGAPNKMENVFLDFMPVATAVEVTLRNLAWKENVSDGQTFNLTSVVISSRTGNALSGCFEADLSTMEGIEFDGNGNGRATDYPSSVKVADKVATSSTISIPMYANGTSGNPLELKFGDAVTFTVFILPTNNIEDLNITINGLQGSRTGTLEGITVEKHKKTYLKSVPITGDVLPFNFESWIRWIDDDVLIRSLSIPGSGGSATYRLNDNGTVDGNTVTATMVRQQNYDIADQWNAGVRCFEFSVDVNGTSESNSLGGSNIVCSGLELDYTLSDAVSEVKDLLLDNYYEFAMVIITYDTKGGWYTKSGNTYTSNRNPALFMEQLKNFWTEVQEDDAWALKNDTLKELGSPIATGTALYDPRDVTVGNARGKLFCIARPTSINVDYGNYVLEDPLLHTTGMASDGQYKWENLSGNGYSDLLTTNGTKKISPPELSNHEHILIIHGWGTDKDKWGQRGFSRYSVRRTKCNDQTLWSGFSFLNSYPSLEWLHTVTTLPAGTTVTINGTSYTLKVQKDGRIGRPFDTSKFYSNGSGNNQLTYDDVTYYGNSAIASHYEYDVTSLKDSVNFKYQTSAGISAWVQEWARVSPSSTTFQFKSTGTEDIVYQVYWTESYNEKFSRVTETLEYAQNKTMGDIVYINSLSGYYITDVYPQSIQPCSNTDATVFHMWGGQIATPSSTSTTSGMGGDIEGFARKINEDFYNYLLGTNTDYEAGSMGIIIIDRVGDGAGAKIPGVIIANNFQFDLESEVNATMSLIDAESEDPQYAPATRTADGEEEVMMVWE